MVIELIGESVSLYFNVTLGLPEAEHENITWSIVQPHEYKQLPLNTTTMHVFSPNFLSLTINDLNYNDEGKYQLEVCNQVGCGADRIHLVVEGKRYLSFIRS